MGTYNKGILGAFSGKVGPVVGASWRGIEVLRSAPKKTSREPTENQLAQREKFKTVTKFITPLKIVTSRYFGSDSGEQSRANRAMGYHLKEAVAYEDGVAKMIYTKVLISKGDLMGLQAPTVNAVANQVLQLAWEDNSGQATAKPTDKLVVVAFNPESGLSAIFLDAGTRADRTANVTLPSHFQGSQAQCWITFASVSEKLYATSVYMGEVGVL